MNNSKLNIKSKFVITTCRKCKTSYKVKNDTNRPIKCKCGGILYLGAYEIGTLSDKTKPNL